MSAIEIPQPNRRSVLKLGLVGAALVGGGGWIATRLADGNPDALLSNARYLSPAAQQALTRICDAFLHGMLPEDVATRDAVMQKVIASLDNTIGLTPPHVQKELLDLLQMLTFAPTRLALLGHWQGWDNASRADVTAMLEGLRDSRFALKRFVYVALHDFATAGYYSLEESWQYVGYDGPMLSGPGEEV